jgi:hypothetical protein
VVVGWLLYSNQSATLQQISAGTSATFDWSRANKPDLAFPKFRSKSDIGCCRIKV